MGSQDGGGTPAEFPRLAEISRDDTVLERNLAALGERNADVVAAIRAAGPATLDWSVAADGSPIAATDGRVLASRHQPRLEAATLADVVDLRERAAVAILGFGLGYHVAELCERMERSGLVAVLEPDLGLLNAVLSRIDLSASLARSNLILFAGHEEPRASPTARDLKRRRSGSARSPGKSGRSATHPAAPPTRSRS